MIKNDIVKEAYAQLLEDHDESEANYILLNSLAILGDKKVQVKESLDSEGYKRINGYKYPERLSSFIKTTSEKSSEWKNLSFAKLACN